MQLNATDLWEYSVVRIRLSDLIGSKRGRSPFVADSVNPDSPLICVHLRIAFLHHRQHHLKRRPHALLTLHSNLSIVIANNGVNDRQPQARALVGVFCREKRLKKTLPGCPT